jgi:DNA (cytosine-5)-methyltransferase 1
MIFVVHLWKHKNGGITMPCSIEICAGAGGQALGLETAGFSHVALVEIEKAACDTLLLNRPGWNVINGDIRSFSGTAYKGIDLLAGGVPCPPFSKAGKQLGSDDERDLFPEAIRLADEIRPKAIMLLSTNRIVRCYSK